MNFEAEKLRLEKGIAKAVEQKLKEFTGATGAVVKTVDVRMDCIEYCEVGGGTQYVPGPISVTVRV